MELFDDKLSQKMFSPDRCSPKLFDLEQFLQKVSGDFMVDKLFKLHELDKFDRNIKRTTTGLDEAWLTRAEKAAKAAMMEVDHDVLAKADKVVKAMMFETSFDKIADAERAARRFEHFEHGMEPCDARNRGYQHTLREISDHAELTGPSPSTVPSHAQPLLPGRHPSAPAPEQGQTLVVNLDVSIAPSDDLVGATITSLGDYRARRTVATPSDSLTAIDNPMRGLRLELLSRCGLCNADLSIDDPKPDLFAQAEQILIRVSFTAPICERCRSPLRLV